MFMTKKNKTKKDPPAPKRAVVKNKDTGYPMVFDENTGMFKIARTFFTVFPSKHAASRAINRMCEEHDPDFWRLHEAYEYEE